MKRSRSRPGIALGGINCARAVVQVPMTMNAVAGKAKFPLSKTNLFYQLGDENVPFGTKRLTFRFSDGSLEIGDERTADTLSLI